MTRSATLITVAAGLVPALVAAGCSSGSTPAPDRSTRSSTAVSAPTAAPSTAPFAPTYVDLVRALPDQSQLPGWTISTRCVRAKAPCAQTPGREGGHGTFVSASGSQRGQLRERLNTSLIIWPSAATARRVSAEMCSRAENDYTGVFDCALDDHGDGSYQPGEKGKGLYTEVERGPWKGCQVAATLRYHLDDETSPPGVHAYALLVRDRFGVFVEVDRWADRSGSARAGPTFRRLLGGVLSRLDTSTQADQSNTGHS